MVEAAGFSYSRPALSAAQASSAKVHDQVVMSQQKLSGATPETIAAHPGWESSSALQACLTAWEQRLQQLESQVRKISGNLSTNIDGYDAVEEQVTGDIQAAATGLKTPPAARKGSRGNERKDSRGK